MDTQVKPTGKVTPVKTKNGRGCFFYGCLTCVILTILSLVAIFFVVRGLVHSYTSERALRLEPVTVSDDVVKTASAKIALFMAAVQGQGGSATISLTDTEINTLIAHGISKAILEGSEKSKSGESGAVITPEQVASELAYAKDIVRVRIVGDTIGGQVSIDLAPMGFPGRFLNGDSAAYVSLHDGKLDVKVKSLIINGFPIPDSILSQIQGENIAENFGKTTEQRDFLRKVQSIEVKNGQVTVVANRH